MGSSRKPPSRHGIALKKKHGQCFLKDENIIHSMISEVSLDDQTTVVEIGCGEGILTRLVLQEACKQLFVFEIDQEWCSFVKKTYGQDGRLHIFCENILDVLFGERLREHTPIVVLANLPYHITFPIFYMFHAHRELLNEGVVMIQEEVAQKLVKTSGRSYGYSSLFFQHYFEMRLLDKVPPSAFYPSPKVNSRLLYFKPRKEVQEIPNEEQFWKFIKTCFQQPRRTLRNNLAQTQYDENLLEEDLLKLRAQQLSMVNFLEIWQILSSSTAAQ